MWLGRWIALLTITLCPLAFSSEISCKVVAISDGDTFTCLDASRSQIKVRMANIDTPESKQPYGQKAKQELSELLFGKNITLEAGSKDRYGRTIGHAYVDGVHANREMVARGAAWVYRQYNSDQSLIDLEQSAKAARLGLWGLSEAEVMPPWEWRKSSKTTAGLLGQRKPLTTEVSGLSCGTKRYCGEMRSCEEAKFYLQQCGVISLDRDRDGVPCEKICR